mmetsp:Transcript_48443/g.152181  ORF Transcript_48443/g.152181 Transcript_48443/m.152181 type:complete len:412 (+) Transcript_48443:33-1268(+)
MMGACGLRLVPRRAHSLGPAPLGRDVLRKATQTRYWLGPSIRLGQACGNAYAEGLQIRAFSAGTAAVDNLGGSPSAEAERIDLGMVPFHEASATASHVPQLYEALQKCGLGPAAVDFQPLDDDASEVAAGLTLGGVRWEVRVNGSWAVSKRLNETPAQASLRCAKHMAAGHLMADARFAAALKREAAARIVAKQARAAALRAARLGLPTMTDLVMQRFVTAGPFSIETGWLSRDELAKVPMPECIGVDTEGFEVSRNDWKRAWLVQLAFRRKSKEPHENEHKDGTVLVLFAKADAEMDLFAEWMTEAAARGCRFYFFDTAGDIPAIFRGGAAPPVLAASAVDLKRLGPSLHALAGEHLFHTEVRKHERLGESMAYLPDTQGITDAQAAYAAADAIATLELGLQLLPPEGAH